MNIIKNYLITALLVLCFSGVAQASSVVIGATDVIASSDDPYDEKNIINQSGLSGGYVSGVTDFLSYTSTTTASYGVNPSFTIGGVGGLGSFYFDLGSLYSISGIATWGQDCCTATITGYDLYVSDTFGVAGSRTLIGSFSAGLSPNAYSHSFGPVLGQFFEIDVTGNMGYPASRLNEVVFGAELSPVPVPAAAWLFGSALIAFAGWSRRKAKAV